MAAWATRTICFGMKCWGVTNLRFVCEILFAYNRKSFLGFPSAQAMLICCVTYLLALLDRIQLRVDRQCGKREIQSGDEGILWTLSECESIVILFRVRLVTVRIFLIVKQYQEQTKNNHKCAPLTSIVCIEVLYILFLFVLELLCCLKKLKSSSVSHTAALDDTILW